MGHSYKETFSQNLQLFSNGDNLPPGDTDVLAVNCGSATGVWQVEARSSAKRPTMHGTARRELSGQKRQ